MKKTLFLTSLLCLSLIFVGCDKNKPAEENNLPNTEIEQQTPTEEVINNEEINNEEINNEEINNEEINNEEANNEENNNEEEINNEVVNNQPTYIPGDYEVDTHEEMTFEEIGNTLSKCDELGEDPVCGKDGVTYPNRCYLEFAGMEEETEAARVVDGMCIYS